MNSSILLRCIDFETSNTPELGGEVIEAGHTDVTTSPGGNTVLGYTFSSRFRNSEASPIVPAARQAHHIHDHELASSPYFSVTDATLLLQCEAATTRQADFVVAHNYEFEKAMLIRYGVAPDGRWICTMKVAKRLFPSAESHSLQFLRYYLNLEGGYNSPRGMPPHAAGPDTYITALLLRRMLDEIHPAEMASITLAPTYYHTCPIGKHKGKLWADVDSGYLIWMTKAPDMEPDIKTAAQLELNSRTYPKW